MTKGMEIKYMQQADWVGVAEIYRQGIDSGNATFQTEVPSWEEWDRAHLTDCRMVAWIDNEMAGWAALSAVSTRCVYAGVAEVSVYVSDNHQGKGVGQYLMERLVDESEAKGIWTLQAGIFPENTASIRLHEKMGFRRVGYREKIGKMNGTWRDTVFMERRSKRTGI